MSNLFGRGYSELNRKLDKGSKYTMSCFNCEDYYQAVGDQEEVCQNSEVIQYDMIVTETSIYCSRWRPCKTTTEEPTNSVKKLFKKRRT